MDPLATLREMLQNYRHFNQFGMHNEMLTEIIDLGHLKVKMKIKEMHCASPNTCHGGVTAALMDAALGGAALSKVILDQKLVSTIEFKINYLRPVHLDDELEATAKVDYCGATTIVCSADIVSTNKGKIVAKGIGTFNSYPLSKHTSLNNIIK